MTGVGDLKLSPLKAPKPAQDLISGVIELQHCGFHSKDTNGAMACELGEFDERWGTNLMSDAAPTSLSRISQSHSIISQRTFISRIRQSLLVTVVEEKMLWWVPFIVHRSSPRYLRNLSNRRSLKVEFFFCSSFSFTFSSSLSFTFSSFSFSLERRR